MENREKLRLKGESLLLLKPPFSYKPRDNRVRGLQLLQWYGDSDLGFGVWG